MFRGFGSVGFWGCGVWGLGVRFRIQSSGLSVWDLGFRIEGLGLRFQDLGFRVKGFRLRRMIPFNKHIVGMLQISHVRDLVHLHGSTP